MIGGPSGRLSLPHFCTMRLMSTTISSRSAGSFCLAASVQTASLVKLMRATLDHTPTNKLILILFSAFGFVGKTIKTIKVAEFVFRFFRYVISHVTLLLFAELSFGLLSRL